MQTKKRIVGIDLLRSFAILGAMASHAFTSADAFEGNDSPLMLAARLGMGLATPIFICLFGSMLEVVYRKRIGVDGLQSVSRKLLSRALQCYLLYVLVIGLRFALGDFSLGYAVRCALLIGVTPFSDILKFYALVLAVAPLLLRVSMGRIGFVGLCLFALSIQILHPLLPVVSVPHEDVFGGNYVSFAAGFFYGGGVGPGGPSLLHGLTLVIYGMALGRLAQVLLDASKAGRLKARLCLAGACLALAVVGAALWPWDRHIDEAVQSLVGMTYRNGNYPIYFALGCLAATLSLWAFLEVYDVRGWALGASLSFIGSTSLFTFSFGNMILVAAPELQFGPTLALLYALLLLLAVFGLSWLFWKSLKVGRRHLAEGRAGSLATWARLQYALTGSLSLAVSGVAANYAELLDTRTARSQP